MPIDLTQEEIGALIRLIRYDQGQSLGTPADRKLDEILARVLAKLEPHN